MQPAGLYLSNECALKRKDRWNSFNQGVAEYPQMGHAEKVPVQTMSKPISSVHYLPMHGVQGSKLYDKAEHCL